MADLYRLLKIIDIDPSPRDIYEVYYDKDEEDNGPSNYFVVEKNGVVITSGNSFNFNELDDRSRERFRVVDSQIEFNTATEKTSFSVLSRFPYAKRNREVFEDNSGEDDIDDMVLILSQTPATDGLTNDGSISPSATGTNTPFTFAISQGNQFYTPAEIAAQISGGDSPFGALYAGDYNPVGKDSKGFTKTAPITVLTEPLSGATAYGVLYDFTFLDGVSQQYKVEIQERDFVGSVTTLTTIGNNPAVITSESESKEIQNIQLMPKKITVELVSTSFREFSEFLGGDEEKYKIILYRNNAGFEKQYESFLLPEETQEDFYSSPYIITLFGSDRLADLSNFIWEFDVFLSEMSILKVCLDTTNIINGYRIAMDIFDAGQNSLTDTPLHQTYVDTVCYDGQTYEEIVKHILKPYNAIVQSWEGFWYIERLQEKADTSVSYKEYTSALVANGSSSYNPRVTFKANDQADKYRWEGRQVQSFTNLYRNVDVTLDLQKKTGGLSDGFDNLRSWTKQFPSSLGFHAVLFNTFNKEIQMKASRVNSEIFAKKSGQLEHSLLDEIELSLKIKFAVINDADILDVDALAAPYAPFKWKFSVGGKWLDTSGFWSDTEVVNQFLITDLNSEDELRIRVPMFGAGGSASEYTLFFYAISVFEADAVAVSDALMIDAIEAISTTSIQAGARRVGRSQPATGDLGMYYYELRRNSSTDASDISNIKPDDHATSLKRWFLVSQWDYDQDKYGNGGIADGFSGVFSYTYLSDFDLRFYPNADDAPDEEKLNVIATRANNRDLEIDLFHHDLTGNISSDQFLYTNFLQLSDGTQTTEWTDSTGTRQIQRHFMDLMQKLYRRPRVVINGQFSADAYVTPLSMLYTASDDNKVYLITGMSFNYKSRRYSGEVMEVSSDSLPLVNDFLVGDFLAADWN